MMQNGEGNVASWNSFATAKRWLNLSAHKQEMQHNCTVHRVKTSRGCEMRGRNTRTHAFSEAWWCSVAPPRDHFS